MVITVCCLISPMTIAPPSVVARANVEVGPTVCAVATLPCPAVALRSVADDAAVWVRRASGAKREA